jgi:hypothetical protein
LQVHGWLGLLVVSLHSANYLGDWFEWSSFVSDATKKTFVPMHEFLSLFTFAMACFQVREQTNEDGITESRRGL